MRSPLKVPDARKLVTSLNRRVNNAQSITGVFEDTINEITRRLKGTFARAGEAITRDFEESNRRVSAARPSLKVAERKPRSAPR